MPFPIRGTGTSQVALAYLDRLGTDQQWLPLAQWTERLPVTDVLQALAHRAIPYLRGLDDAALHAGLCAATAHAADLADSGALTVTRTLACHLSQPPPHPTAAATTDELD